jgi:hypothetical protein
MVEALKENRPDGQALFLDQLFANKVSDALQAAARGRFAGAELAGGGRPRIPIVTDFGS